ncbi:MAG: hypothetical protein GC149_13385 [Gammaproteobacteria bacterium]|nr:hypothetical protein [Gammaproteobacteria bacterium]
MLKILNVIFSIIAFLFLVGGSFYFGYEGKTIEMGLAIVAGALGIALSNIDKFESIKGAGFEAKMRKAIEEAYATTESLKKIATVLGRTISDVLAVEDRYAGIGQLGKFDSKKQIDEILLELGVNQTELSRIGTVFDAYIRYDHVERVIELISKDPNIDDSVKIKVSSLARFSKHPYAELPYAADLQEIQLFIKEHGITSNEVLDAIKDYEYFMTNYKLRRPKIWS